MEKLPQVFTRREDGKVLTYTQKRVVPVADSAVYVYIVTKEDGGIRAHEVVIPRVQKKDIQLPKGYMSRAGEKYPSTEMFGSKGLYIAGESDVTVRSSRIEAAIKELSEKLIKSKESKDAGNAKESSNS